jgi:hypothetical protein
VVWVVQAGRGMVRGHDQPCGSTPAQPAVGPHPAPAAAATAAPPRRRPRHVPDRNCVAALLFMARTSTPGTCCPPRSWAAAARPPAGAAWTSGPAQGCSSSSRRCCWTNWARPAASTWSGSWSTPPASARSKGALTGANPVDRGKQGTKLHLAGDAAGRAPSTPTRATTTHAAARSCDAVGSPPASPGAAWSPRSGLAATAGGSSGRSPGGGCGSAN